MIKLIKYIVFLFGAASFLFSCSPEARLRRLVDRHPELVKHDTITIMDTVIVPEVRVDTVFSATNFCKGNDTIVIEKDRLKLIEYVRNDSIFIEAECTGDTIVQTFNVPVDKLIYTEKDDWTHWIWLGASIVLNLVLLYLLGKQKN